MKIFLFFLPFLFLGCCALGNNLNNGQVTVQDKYQFTYSPDYWEEADSFELYSVMEESGNYDIEKAFFSKNNEDTAFLTQSFNGQSSCENLTADLLDYAVMNSKTKQIAGKEWCIGTGYKSTPSEASTVAIINCDNNFVILFLINSDSDKSKSDSEFNKVLESFKCI